MDRSSAQQWGTHLTVLAVLAAGLLLARHELFSDNGHPRQLAQQVTLLDEPRPPPPPPPPIDKKLEEEPPQPWVEAPNPAFADPSPPPRPLSDQLGLDASGEGGGDAFGMQALRGGRDITTLAGEQRSGTGGGSSAISWAWYGGVIEQHLQQVVNAEPSLHRQTFDVVVMVWVASDGRLTRLELVGSSGHGEVDQQLRKTLLRATPLQQLPPTDMPQPVTLRITSHFAAAELNPG